MTTQTEARATKSFAEMRAILSAFRRHHPPRWVPLTAEEADRATRGNFSREIRALMLREVLASEQRAGIQTYHLTSKGRRLAQDIGAMT